MSRRKLHGGKKEITTNMFLRRIKKLGKEDILVNQLDTCPFCLGKLKKDKSYDMYYGTYYRVNCSNCSFVCLARKQGDC